ncbi:TerB family tellurite resistance protein [Vibrio owensii]|uniref:tellurite resistance TerB family protein n=1 Tax=Vibrio owensii TaxID=696485 RepID=UPI00148D0865|nr:TerB family tellurite resistance protein [Vibrio owensii]NOI69606.1 TerB family tellurite resistance protein [Vibrio owensii]
MSFWKVLGGACAGVAAVVALPIAGPVGAVTAVGAAVAAGIGAAAGGVAEYYDESESEAEERGKRQGKELAMAEYEKRTRDLEAKLAKAIEKLEGSAKYFNAIIAMESVAMACANCDGEISESERENIELFIGGVVGSELPQDVKTKIEGIYKKPPTPAEAFALANRSGVDVSVFNEIIELVMHADGVQHENEKAFLDAWNIAKSA